MTPSRRVVQPQPAAIPMSRATRRCQPPSLPALLQKQQAKIGRLLIWITANRDRRSQAAPLPPGWPAQTCHALLCPVGRLAVSPRHPQGWVPCLPSANCRQASPARPPPATVCGSSEPMTGAATPSSAACPAGRGTRRAP